ncbi:MAG: outer membrane lipoprotein-sorting protein [Acidobacteriota bacterium]
MIRNVLFALLIPLTLRAEDAANVLARTDQSRNSMSSFAVDVELTSTTPDGRHETSKFRVYGKGSDRSVVEFIAPQTEKGKVLLMLRDAMWIYMPSASRPIRISPLQRLMGQASNGDVARTNFTVDYQPGAIAEEAGAWILELKAKDPAVAYNRVRLWVDKKSFEPRRADFYVVSGKLIKRATYDTDRVEIDDALRPGHRTVMRYTNRVARENPERMFTKDALGKW